MRPTLFLLLLCGALQAAQPRPEWPGDALLKTYFAAETARLESACLRDIGSAAEWEANRGLYREQLFEMLGLSPRPPKTELHPTITGKLEGYGFTVEKLHFQSMPGLYVGANFYLPKEHSGKLPAILYVCGHASVKTNGVSYGNKTFYQHHAEWFARHGYACLVLDTIELGEIQGLHHGTYREGMWWWNSRGYTPAGVEAWNGIRALDYLESRTEVDPTRVGITGRSGGGAYSWFVSALDDRIKVAAPVAGITDLHNHVVDGVVEGHCDCMFTVNTYRWDYPKLAALVAPRPLLICNSDKDSIFPLDGVERLHRKVAAVYKLLGATNKLGLLVTEGPHKDTQDLQIPVFRWFNRWLKNEDPVIEIAARPFFTPMELKVFGELPPDERTSRIHETFVPTAQASARPARDELITILREKCFRGWPDLQIGAPALRQIARQSDGGISWTVHEFLCQEGVPLRIYSATQGANRPARFTVLDQTNWLALTREWPNAREGLASELALAERLGESTSASLLVDKNADQYFLAPRGVGLTTWDPEPKHSTQIRRRFMLLGQTVDAMRVYDIVMALRALKAQSPALAKSLTLAGDGSMGINAVYASLFEPVHEVKISNPPASHMDGPDYLNVLRFTDIPQTLAAAGVKN